MPRITRIYLPQNPVISLNNLIVPSDGNTYVASMNIGVRGKVFGGAVDKTMSKVAADDKNILGFAE